MPLPYPVKFKLPLEYLSLEDWNNFVKNLLFIDQTGSAKLLQYYKNGNFQNLNDVFAEQGFFDVLKVNGYNVLHNLSAPSTYTFADVFEILAQKYYPSQKIPLPIFKQILEVISFYLPTLSPTEIKTITEQIVKMLLYYYKFKSYQVTTALVPKLKTIGPALSVWGTQITFSGTQNLANFLDSIFATSISKYVKSIIIRNLGKYPLQINNSIYLLPNKILKITVSSPNEITISASQPTLLATEVETYVAEIIPTYQITLTNNQSNPTPSPFQQLLILNLSNIISQNQLLNLLFCADMQCTQPLYAWIESASSLSSVYVWVLLPNPIPPNSSINIYMRVTNSIQYPYTGINPYYNNGNINYDNANSIFLFYTNWMGNSPSGNTNYETSSLSNVTPTFVPYSSGTPGYLQTLTGQSGSYSGIRWSSSNVNKVNIIVEASSYYNGNADMQGFTIYGSGSSSLISNCEGGSGLEMWSDSLSVSFDPAYNVSNIYYNENCVASGSSLNGNGYNFWQLIITSSQTILNYLASSSPFISTPSSSPTNLIMYDAPYSPTGSMIALGDGSGGASHTGYWYWIRVRQYPPNGVMPSNSQPIRVV